MSSVPRNDVDPVREVTRVYNCLEDWRSGIRADITPVSGSLASEFVRVRADGIVEDRTATIETLRDQEAIHREMQPPFRISVEDITELFSVYDLHMMSFRVRRYVEGQWEERTTTALLRENDDAITGLEWVFVQETDRDVQDEADSE